MLQFAANCARIMRASVSAQRLPALTGKARLALQKERAAEAKVTKVARVRRARELFLCTWLGRRHAPRRQLLTLKAHRSVGLFMTRLAISVGEIVDVRTDARTSRRTGVCAVRNIDCRTAHREQALARNGLQGCQGDDVLWKPPARPGRAVERQDLRWFWCQVQPFLDWMAIRAS